MNIISSQGILHPFCKNNSGEDQESMEAALSALAQDKRNEIWVVSHDKLAGNECIYSCISPGLNFASRNGLKFSARNRESVKPPADLIDSIQKEAITLMPRMQAF
jgi:hypothetical protein